VKILLLEDDFKLATEVQLFLTRQGYQCELVYDGLIFFKQSIRDDYDLYLLDINVPSLNGLDVCKKIRESDPQTPILMLTAYSVVEDKVHGAYRRC
jgi:DNA-binding response OmpR family regulator